MDAAVESQVSKTARPGAPGVSPNERGCLLLSFSITTSVYLDILREDFGVYFGEEGFVEAADYVGRVVFFDYEG